MSKISPPTSPGVSASTPPRGGTRSKLPMKRWPPTSARHWPQQEGHRLAVHSITRRVPSSEHDLLSDLPCPRWGAHWPQAALRRCVAIVVSQLCRAAQVARPARLVRMYPPVHRPASCQFTAVAGQLFAALMGRIWEAAVGWCGCQRASPGKLLMNASSCPCRRLRMVGMKEMSTMPKLLTAAGAVIATAAMTWAGTAVPSSAQVASAVTGRASSLRPPTAYVTLTTVPAVRPINTATNRPLARIPVGPVPVAIVITPDGRTAYVSNGSGLTPIHTATNTPGTPIRGGGGKPIAITPDGKTVYCVGLDTVTPVHTATNTAGTPIFVGRDPGAIAITPNGKRVYVVNNRFGTVITINTATNKRGKTIHVGQNPRFIAITPDGRTAYVASDLGVVTPINIATNTPGTPIGPVSAEAGPIAITPNGKTAYVVGFDTVTPIHTATNTAGKPIPTGTNNPGAITITPDGTKAYVADFSGKTVTPISTATNKAGPPIPVAGEPEQIAITPNGKTAYVITAGGGRDGRHTVTPITTATNKAGPPILAGRGASAIAITP